MNNCIRVTNIADSTRPEFATYIHEDGRGYYNSVGIEHKPFPMGRTDMNRILANTTTWKVKFKAEYHAKTT